MTRSPIPTGGEDQTTQLAGLTRTDAPVTPVDWELLAAFPGQRTGLVGMAASSQESLDVAWTRHAESVSFDSVPEAPSLPPGRDALAVSVPGTCMDATQIRDVEVVASTAAPDSRMPIVRVDPGCAQVRTEGRTVQPATLFVLSVPAGTAETTVLGPHVFIDCGNHRDGPCQDAEGVLVPTIAWFELFSDR